MLLQVGDLNAAGLHDAVGVHRLLHDEEAVAARAEDLAGDPVCLVAAEPGHLHPVHLRVGEVGAARGGHAAGAQRRRRHPGAARGRHGDGANTVPCQLHRHGVRHRRDPALRPAVVRLAEVAVVRPRRRRDQHPAVALFPHLARRRLAGVERSKDVHVEDVPHLLLRHIQERPVAQDAGVRHHRVDLPELRHALVDDLLRPLSRVDGVVVHDRRPNLLVDDVDGLLRLFEVDVVDHDRGAFLRQPLRVTRTDAASRTRHHRRLAVYYTHDVPPVGYSILACSCRC